MAANNAEDNRAQQRYWFEKNGEKKRQQVYTRFQKHKEMINEFKIERGCIICEEKHIACLVFHHRDPSTKIGSLNELLRRGFSWEKLLDEINKCDVMCSNCHRKLHYKIRQAPVG